MFSLNINKLSKFQNSFPTSCDIDRNLSRGTLLANRFQTRLLDRAVTQLAHLPAAFASKMARFNPLLMHVFPGRSLLTYVFLVFEGMQLSCPPADLKKNGPETSSLATAIQTAAQDGLCPGSGHSTKFGARAARKRIGCQLRCLDGCHMVSQCPTEMRR